jgi:hypothetical protein
MLKFDISIHGIVILAMFLVIAKPNCERKYKLLPLFSLNRQVASDHKLGERCLGGFSEVDITPAPLIPRKEIAGR